MTKFASFALQIAVMPLPWRMRRRILSLLLRFELDPESYIGFSMVGVKRCIMRAKSRIGNFNIIRNLDHLELGEDAGIGTFNNITGYPSSLKGSFSHVADRRCHLTMEAMSGLTSRHFVDCTCGVTVGRKTTVAGIRSTILTHSIDVRRNRQDAAPVEFGEACFIGTNVIVLPGVTISNYCVVAAGSVVNKSLEGSGTVYAGNPIQHKRTLDFEETEYFHRSVGNVD